MELGLDGSYQSKIVGNTRVLDFQTNARYGQLLWWENHQFHTTDAMGVKKFPLNVHPVLKFSDTWFDSTSSPFAELKEGDLGGAILRVDRALADMSNPQATTNLLVNFATISNSMRILDLNKVSLTETDYKYLDYLSQVRWLRLNEKVELKRFSRLSFVPNLRLLHIENFDEISPLLQRLNSNRITRLWTDECQLHEADYVSIGNLHNLQYLFLKGPFSVQQFLRALKHLNDLKHLKVLACSTRVMTKEELKQVIPELKKLRFDTFILRVYDSNVDLEDSEMARVLSSELKGRQIKVIGNSNSLPSAYFDLLTTDPNDLDIF